MSDRDRSFWGWGYADRFPGEDERQALAERLQTELGFPERPLLEPPTIESVAVPDTSLDVPSRLEDVVTIDREERIRHTHGRAYRDLVRGFHGEYSAAPDAVATPGSEEAVERLLAWASEVGVAVVPYGGGTSVVGGVEPAVDPEYAGVVTCSLAEMTDTLAVNETDRTARFEAGITGPALNASLETHGLQLRHYPQSYEFSTLGGWVATRAGGHFATRYTHIDDFLQRATAVTPSGRLSTNPVPASGAGPDPNRFLLGSEGAFGVITDATVRVQPRPEHRASATVLFEDFERGVDATRAIAQSRLYPANCRLLDPMEAMINEVRMDGSTVLVLGFESIDGPVDAQLERALSLCEERGGTPTDGSGNDSGPGRDWRKAFLEGPYLFNTLVSIGVLVDTFETATTWERFPALHAALTEAVTATMRETCGTGVLSCRFTHVYPDGPAPYYTILAPADPGRELEQWRPIKETAAAVLLEHGATITHHHAVGRIHRPWYEREMPEQYLGALRSMKRTLDPAGVMNPGVLLSGSE